MSKKLFTILSALILVSMLLGACGTKTTAILLIFINEICLWVRVSLL